MNNEEKILSILESMSNEIGNIKGDINDMRGRLITVEKTVAKTNLTIENEIVTRLNALADGRKLLVERLWDLPDEVEKIKESVEILDFIQKTMVKNRN